MRNESGDDSGLTINYEWDENTGDMKRYIERNWTAGTIKITEWSVTLL